MDIESLVLIFLAGLNLGCVGGCIYMAFRMCRLSNNQNDDKVSLDLMMSDLDQIDQDIYDYFRGTGEIYTSDRDLHKPSRRKVRRSIRRLHRRMGKLYPKSTYQDHIDDCRWMVMHAEKALDYLFKSDPESNMISKFRKLLEDAKGYVQPIQELITKLKFSDSDDEKLVDDVAKELSDLQIQGVTIINFIRQLLQINPDDVTTLIIGNLDQ